MEEWEHVHRKGAHQRTRSRERANSVTRNPKQQPYRPPNHVRQREKNVPEVQGQKGGLEGPSGPRERSRSRPRTQMQWKPTGNVYPIEGTYLRPRDEFHPPDAGKNKAVIENIPTSPNKFALLATKNTSDPKEDTVVPSSVHQNIVQDLLAAVLPPILAGLQGNATLEQRAPFVNSERRHRSKSRDPRIPRETEQNESNKVVADPKEGNREETTTDVVEEVVAVENEGENLAAANESTVGNKKHKKALKGCD